MFGVIVLGAGALLDYMTEWKTAASATTVILGTLDLVFNLSERASRHSFLRKQYFDVAADLERADTNPETANMKMMALASEEEPIKYAVHALAQNWATTAVFGDAVPKPCKLKFHHRLLRHAVRFEGVQF